MGSSRMMLIFALLIAAGFATAPARAQDAAKIVQDRQALMKEQGGDMGAIKAFLDDKADQAKAAAAATDLTQTMGKIPAVFPEGMTEPAPAADAKYAVKPEVASDRKGFLDQRDIAAGKADALLVAVKGGDKPTIQAAFADMGKNGCGGCHGKFREEIKK
jgi:cytochrome c556